MPITEHYLVCCVIHNYMYMYMLLQCTCRLVRVHYTFISKQKLEERSASLRKVKFADTRDREKVMTVEFISCEDSGSDEGDEVLIVRPLPCSTYS